MNYRSPLGKAQGLGSAKSGTSHWWMQRITAIALLPLSAILIRFLDLSLNAPYEQTKAWLASPFNSVCLTAWILAVFYHSALGLRVVIEDYIGNEGWKIFFIWTINLIVLFLALAALIGVFRSISAG